MTAHHSISIVLDYGLGILAAESEMLRHLRCVSEHLGGFRASRHTDQVQIVPSVSPRGNATVSLAAQPKRFG
jgi:hypothetical protein